MKHKLYDSQTTFFRVIQFVLIVCMQKTQKTKTIVFHLRKLGERY